MTVSIIHVHKESMLGGLSGEGQHMWEIKGFTLASPPSAAMRIF